MTRVNHPTKEKFQVPVEQQVTAYALSRARLEERKAIEARIKKLCTTTGMAYNAAKRSIEMQMQTEETRLQPTSS